MYIYVYIYVYMFTLTPTHTHTHTPTHTHIHTHIYTHTQTPTDTHTYTHTRPHTHKSTHVHIHPHTHPHIHTHTHIPKNTDSVREVLTFATTSLVDVRGAHARNILAQSNAGMCYHNHVPRRRAGSACKTHPRSIKCLHVLSLVQFERASRSSSHRFWPARGWRIPLQGLKNK